ncbi:pectinesterase family protein [Arcticibacter sp.]|uniref:pectinesterase family protein n=1 Tax=Arcticibacter sp. TaxID=1872630 RepID=UPI00388DF530
MKTFLLFCLISCFVAETAAQKNADFVVAADGSGDFRTVQQAINAVPDFRKTATVIFIKDGVYKEKLIVAGSKARIKFIGESVENTILTYDDYSAKKNVFGEDMGTSGSSSVYIYGDEFSAENITFQNSSGPVGQAVAVWVAGDKVQFKNCRFLGFQDTLYTYGYKSRQYYKDCYIEGTVDFIFGSSTAVFENCEIFCKKSGYITAASTHDSTKYGYVFLDCRIKGNGSPGSFYLGRPWRPYAKTVFIRCAMDDIVHPVGWNNWGKESNEKTVYYAEYKNTGEGFKPGKRVTWSHQLSDLQVQEYEIVKIFDGWVPDK